MSAAAIPFPDSPELVDALLAEARSRWELLARKSQRAPAGDWAIWVIKTGRGWGKTRTAVETIYNWVRSGTCRRLHLVAPTAADARDTMVEGESGIMACAKPGFLPKYEPSKRRITWPNGAIATLFSAEEPERLRGPQCDAWWSDELCAWKYPQETWDMLQFGARLGDQPRGIVTTTPKPLKLLKDIMKRKDVVVTSGHTYENRANLAVSYIAHMNERYENTRLGRQELAGEILDDNPAALWKRAWLDRDRVAELPKDGLARIIVAVDPTASSCGDACGIVTAGITRPDPKTECYVLADDTMSGSPMDWGRAAVAAFHKNKADRIVYEANQGGEMVAHVLRSIDRNVPLSPVHATRGKAVRAEPVSSLYEQARVHHVGFFPDLEDEMCEWDPADASAASPNRMDALVWAITGLTRREPGRIQVY